jgi:hypothetical protein
MRRITRSYRIRAYPNGAQRRLLERWFGASRWLWNTALAIRSEAYRECGLTLTGNDLSRWLTSWKEHYLRRDHTLALSMSGLATVDCDVSTRDPACFVRRQVQGAIGNILGLADTPQRETHPLRGSR